MSSTFASALFRMYSISGGASRQFTATVTALTLPAPKRKVKYSGAFLSRNATRSCGPTPAANNACATRFDSSSTSA